jgi:tRNA(adenine34) deaminase
VSAAAWHERWMLQAIELARVSAANGEVPVGAVVVAADGAELGCGSNQPIGANDPTAHAEIVALRAAGRAAANYRFPGSTLYVTVEPCTMCLGALVHARVATLVFGAREPKSGALVSHPIADQDSRFNHTFALIEGVLAQECKELMQRFFAERRRS